MTIMIESEETQNLVRRLAEATGESVEDAVHAAVRERLNRVAPLNQRPSRSTLRDIRERASKLPILDPRTDDEILGYNAHGAFD